jgi:DNA-binding beta-propeller fold protein YncE
MSARFSNPTTLSLVLGATLLTLACARTQTTASQAAPPPPFEYIGEWGTKGDDPGQLSQPEWLATDAAGNAYIADSGSGYINKFAPQGHPLLSFHDGVPNHPFGVAVDRGGGIYVISPGVDSISIFKPEGERIRTLPVRPTHRHQWPGNIVVDQDGNIYLIEVLGDSGRREIRKFSPRGRLLKSWGMRPTAEGRPLTPAAIAFGSDQTLYVVDFTGQAVQKFTRDGDFMSGWLMPETKGELDDRAYNAAGIGVTGNYVFVGDTESRGVIVWTVTGERKLMDDLGGRLHGSQGKFQIVITPHGDLLVLDCQAARVLRYKINLQ